MLEALYKNEDGGVIALKLPGGPWSQFELEYFGLTTDWVDEPLEAVLAARRAAGEVYPQVTTPYAQYDEEGNYIGESRTVEV